MAGCFFSFQIKLFLAWAVLGTWLDNIVTANQGCSQNRRLKFSPPVKDNYLQGHVFYNISFEAHISCEAECLHRKECVAINIGPTIKGIKVCELCNSDHLQHPNDLKSRRGWTYRGTENICVHKPCLNNGKCFLGYTDKKFLCECQSRYTGERCETDIDECEKGSHDCHINANCINAAGSYICMCRPGYTGNGSICNDVDECADNLHDCDANALNCTNTIGSYSCVCNQTYAPYYGDQGKKYINISGFDASTILGNDSRYLENLRSFLEPVINSSVRSRFVRCWHAKEDGWAASTFHGNCDDKGPTVTIIQVGSFIFGAYSGVSWESQTAGFVRYGYSSKAFIYSLTNNNGSGRHAVYNPVKLRVKLDKYCRYLATVSHGSRGPRFGSRDIVISNNATSNQDSYTYCGYSYPLPPGYSLYGYRYNFYAGSYRFTPTDIEVFYETTT